MYVLLIGLKYYISYYYILIKKDNIAEPSTVSIGSEEYYLICRYKDKVYLKHVKLDLVLLLFGHYGRGTYYVSTCCSVLMMSSIQYNKIITATWTTVHACGSF